MKTKQNHINLQNINIPQRPLLAGLLIALVWTQATFGASKVQFNDPPPVPDEIKVGLGVIGVSIPQKPADFSFDKSVGRIDYANDRAGAVARQMLTEVEGAPLPGDQLVAGALGLALAPIAALAGASGAGRKLTSEELSKSELELLQGMSSMAEQRILLNIFLKCAEAKTKRHLALIRSSDTASHDHSHENAAINSVLELTVLELRLEKTGSSDASFAVNIETRVRLIRASDGAVLYDEPYRYRSGTSLFLDYTYNKGEAFRLVTETGYRQLAERMVDRLFQGELADRRPAKAERKHTSKQDLLLAANGPLPMPVFIANPAAHLGTLGITSTSSVHEIAIQIPSTRDQAVSDAIADTEATLEDFTSCRNALVGVIGCAAAIPMSLSKQAMAAFRGLSPKRFDAAQQTLLSAVQAKKLDNNLGYQVAQRLNLDASHFQFARLGADSGGVLPASTSSSAPRNDSIDQQIDTILEIHVQRAVLKGSGVINSRLALTVEALVTVLNARDGREIYSLPIRYCGDAKRTYMQWAANDAQLFRREIDQCHLLLGEKIVAQLAAHQLIVPAFRPDPVVAGR